MLKKKRRQPLRAKNLSLLYVYFCFFSFFVSAFLSCLLVLFVALYRSSNVMIGIPVCSCFYLIFSP